jgi:hypothetical protein
MLQDLDRVLHPDKIMTKAIMCQLTIK